MPARKAVNLNRLAVFAAVVESGSFTAAADRLSLTKAMVSQHITRLEAELGAALLTRTTRKIMPTEAGEAFYADCVRLIREADDAVARVGAGKAAPAGTLKLTAASDYGADVVVPALAAFMERYPQVKVDFVATDQVVDLVGGGFDLAIRSGWLRDSSLRATQLATFGQVVVGSTAYLKKYGTPKRPEDLAEHRWIALSLLRSPLTWTFTGKGGKSKTVRVSAPVTVNSTAALSAFVRAGFGLSVLPTYVSDNDGRGGRLVRLLPDWSLPDGGVFAVYPNIRFPSAKMRAFVDFFRDYLAKR